jgi:hypothetical protein
MGHCLLRWARGMNGVPDVQEHLPHGNTYDSLLFGRKLGDRTPVGARLLRRGELDSIVFTLDEPEKIFGNDAAEDETEEQSDKFQEILVAPSRISMSNW